MHNFWQTISALLLLSGVLGIAQAQEIYMEPDSFVAKHIPDSDQAQSLWVTGELRHKAEEVLNHRPLALRQRYWRQGNLSVWILEEIGKEKPITAGFAIKDHRIIDAQVLIFRESRGWEIRYPAFTDQFTDARMTDRRQLDRRIDGISGATLSVNAMRKLARLALTYHQHITQATTASADRNPQAPSSAGL